MYIYGFIFTFVFYNVCFRVESFIEHQDACTIRRVQPDHLQVSLQQQQQPACSSRTASSTSPSSDNTNFNITIAPLQRSFSMSIHNMTTPPPLTDQTVNKNRDNANTSTTFPNDQHQHNLELQLLPSSSNTAYSSYKCNAHDKNHHATHLKLSIGTTSSSCIRNGDSNTSEATRVVREGTDEQLKMAMAEKAFAEEARQQAKRQIELAEMEFANAKRIRQQAQAEFEKAQNLKEQATKKISSTMLEITCHACKQLFHTATTTAADETSLAMSYVSSAVTEGEGE